MPRPFNSKNAIIGSKNTYISWDNWFLFLLLKLYNRPPLLRRDESSLGDIAVPQGAVLRRTLEGVVVDPDQPKALRVAECPLEVVHERPRKVALDIGALLNGITDSQQVRVQVSLPLDVSDPPRLVRRSRIRGPVLGDDQRWRPILGPVAPRVAEALG